MQSASSAPGGGGGTPPPRLKKGFVHVYTGTGKGKTTAAMGLAARAAGHGYRVFAVCFLKEGIEGGESKALASAGDVTFEFFGRSGHVNPRHPDPADVKSAHRALERAREVIASGAWDVVILDEVNVAFQFGLITLDELLRLVEARPEHVEVVCTGRGAPIELLGVADYVTRMEGLKHPFDRGVEARRGIEE